MHSQEEAASLIDSQIKEMKNGELSVLFLIYVNMESGYGKTMEDMVRSEIQKRADEILSRFFKGTDVIGMTADGRFLAFTCGRFSEKKIREKTETLWDVFHLAGKEFYGAEAYGSMGVYVFENCMENFSSILKMAERALDIAKLDDRKRCYISTAPSMSQEQFSAAQRPLSVQTLMNYIDEGARLIAAKGELRTIYAGPGFYSRIGADPETDIDRQYMIHPEDQKLYERAVREAAAEGRTVMCRYRIKGPHTEWIPCCVRVLKISLNGDKTPAVLEISHDISGLERLENQYGLCREWLDFLLKRTDIQLWDADMKTRTLRLLQTYEQPDSQQSVYPDFPESLVESGKIHRESAERFRKFAEGMFEGNAEGSGNFIIQHRQSGSYAWASMSYRMLFDKEGRPWRAIGVKENIAEMHSRDFGEAIRRAIPEALYPDLYGYVEANLTRDTVEEFQIEGKNQKEQGNCFRYSDRMQFGISKIFSKDDENRLCRRFQRESLLKEYQEGSRWILDQCRIVDAGGVIRWLSIGVNLIREDETEDIYLFAYLSHMDQRKKLENAIFPSALRLSASGLYTESTMKTMAGRLMAKEENRACALAVIRVEGLRELLAGGMQLKNQEAIEIALRVSLGEGCLAGKCGEDGISVFFLEGQSMQEVRKKLEHAIAFARTSLRTMKEMTYLRFLAGVSWKEQEWADYERMLRGAEILCTIHAGEARDAVIFQDSDEDSRWRNLKLNEAETLRMSQHPAKAEKSLTEDEKDAALECLGLLLTEGEEEKGAEQVLSRLGNYYEADRAYILTVSEKGQAVTMLHEWYGRGKHSVRHMISGKRVYDFPLLMRCMTMSEPVFLSQKGTSGDEPGDETLWKFSVFPMNKAAGIMSYLCIENPKKNTERTALLYKMAKYLGIRSRGGCGPQAERNAKERMLSVPNLRSYMDVVYSLDSDMYSSMGALTVDIPKLPDINNWKGYEYGSRLVLRVSEVLSDVFGRGLLFHTQEAEFVVLCANTTYEVFYARCSRVQILLRQQYSKQFRIGYTWSDGVFNAKDLVGKARSIMCCDNSCENMGSHTQMTWGSLQASESQGAERAAGNFTIYLQPKVDMRTGELVGAEALARIMDETGEMMPHGQVIDKMEREGTIRELDYFVFDRVLSVLSQWKKKGYKLMRISSNFSRKTLLNPSALASLLAILSRYPDVPQDLVELEITETAGDFENNTLSDLIEHFGSYGLQFSLDDFGSRYSNMSMLADIHFRAVKLDRSIIRGVADNQVSQMMVKDIVRICASCGMLCIAEGVETQAQVEELLKDGCTYAQGYFYDRPMPLKDFEKEYLISG